MIDIRNLSAKVAALLLALLALAMVASVMAGQQPIAADGGGTRGMTDPQLYRAVIERVSAGEDYYTAAASEHRKGAFPLKPFVAVRLPTLAILFGNLGATAMQLIMLALIAAAIALWYPCFQALTGSKPAAAMLSASLLAGIGIFALPGLSIFHEGWAAALIAVSLGLAQRGNLVLAVVAGLIAALVREFAAAYLLLMLVAGLYDRNWREAIGWGSALLAFALALAAHAEAVATVINAADLVSPGWQNGGGWPLLVSAAHATSLLSAFPMWLMALLLPLSLFGWGTSRSGLGLRCLGLLIGFALMVMLFARPDTFYWASMLAPFVLPGAVMGGLNTVRLAQIWTRGPQTGKELRK
jgi:hypothetical protein